MLEEFVEQPNTLTYADPPYFEKGSQLYLNAFDAEDHVELADVLNAHAGGSWMLTYDDHPTIEALYAERPLFDVGVYYSVRDARKASELLVTSDTLALPEGFATAR